MARIQILELPMEHQGASSVTPFMIILDRLNESDLDELQQQVNLGEELKQHAGARAVIAWVGTLDVT